MLVQSSSYLQIILPPVVATAGAVVEREQGTVLHTVAGSERLTKAGMRGRMGLPKFSD